MSPETAELAELAHLQPATEVDREELDAGPTR